jgi:hypothetical protein
MMKKYVLKKPDGSLCIVESTQTPVTNPGEVVLAPAPAELPPDADASVLVLDKDGNIIVDPALVAALEAKIAAEKKAFEDALLARRRALQAILDFPTNATPVELLSMMKTLASELIRKV